MIGGASFRVTAKAVNSRVWDLVADGRWSAALGFLSDTFPDLPVGSAHAVMRGHAAFVDVDADGAPDPGGDRMQLHGVAGAEAPEGMVEHARAATDVWAGVLLVDGHHSQPYAYVTSVGLEEYLDPRRRLPFTMRMAAERHVTPKTWERTAEVLRKADVRPALFAEDLDEDLVLDARLPPGLPVSCAAAERVRSMPVPFLFRRVPPPPPWVAPVTRADESVDAYVRAGLAPYETGHLQVHGEEVRREAEPVVDEALTRPTAAELSARDAAAARRHAARMAEVARGVEEAKLKVAEQLAMPGRGGRIDLVVDGTTLSVPEAPFVAWALHRVRAANLGPPWTRCSATGLKLGMEWDEDDSYHTDWMIGAGLDVRAVDWYGEGGRALREAAIDLMGRIQDRHLGKGCTVLADGGPRTGPVYVARRSREDPPNPGDVVVLPDSGAHWLDTVVAACRGRVGAVVVAQGGKVAHLVVVTGADGATIVRDPDAMTRYRDGQVVTVDPVGRRVAILAPEAVPAPEEEPGAPSP